MTGREHLSEYLAAYTAAVSNHLDSDRSSASTEFELSEAARDLQSLIGNRSVIGFVNELAEIVDDYDIEEIANAGQSGLDTIRRQFLTARDANGTVTFADFDSNDPEGHTSEQLREAFFTGLQQGIDIGTGNTSMTFSSWPFTPPTGSPNLDRDRRSSIILCSLIACQILQPTQEIAGFLINQGLQTIEAEYAARSGESMPKRANGTVVFRRGPRR